ncbi:MAG: hypothetical protein HY695_13585 [Deltaproteobacteria bacterium]|nr:hypothetical protein [Deltaproteobacteria bacterium]
MAERSTSSEDYAEQAKELQKKLPLVLEWAKDRLDPNANGTRRAFIVEFAGMPKSGKSSTIETVRHFFSHGPKSVADEGWADKDLKPQMKDGYRVDTPAEGVSLRTPNYLRSDPFAYNTWAGAYALQELLQASHDLYSHIVILDRGPWDASCWLQYWKENPPKKKSDLAKGCQQIEKFLRLDTWMTLADLHVVFVIEPEQAAEREKRKRLIQHGGASSNPNLMKAMWTIYHAQFQELQKTKMRDCPHVGQKSALLVDTTNTPQKKVELQVIGAIFSVLDAKIVNRWAENGLTPEKASWLFGVYSEKMLARERKNLLDYVKKTFVDDFNKLSPGGRRAALGELRENYLLLRPESHRAQSQIMIEELKSLLTTAATQ